MAGMFGKKSAAELLKQAWHEIPDIVAGTAMALTSIVGMYFAHEYRKSTGDFDVRRYRFDYTVVRSDDPLARHAPPKEE